MTDKYDLIYSVVLVCLDANKTGVQYKSERGFTEVDEAIAYREARLSENRQEMWELLVQYKPSTARPASKKYKVVETSVNFDCRDINHHTHKTFDNINDAVEYYIEVSTSDFHGDIWGIVVDE